MRKKKRKAKNAEQLEVARTKDFFDCIAPTTIRFYSDHYIIGDSYRCVWAIREYPLSTEMQAILARLGDRNGVTLHIYNRLVDGPEQVRIMQDAQRRNKLRSTSSNISDTMP